jgi:hypothetical protein
MTEVVQIPAFEDFLLVFKITGQKRKCWYYVSAKLGEVWKSLSFFPSSKSNFALANWNAST